MGYRSYYDKDINYLIEEELKWNNLRRATLNAKARLRMYANLFCRDMAKLLINDTSVCKYCGSSLKLTIDHIIPIVKGGKNELSNTQILCFKCNRNKSSK